MVSLSSLLSSSESFASDDAPGETAAPERTDWRTGLAVGAGLAGTAAGLALARRWVRRGLSAPSSLPRAINAATRTLESPGGRTNYYVRDGTGTPIVLLHSFNAAASPFEMRPIFDRLADATDRPIYALDWLGFGRSAREDRTYTPDVYHDQLFHFLDTVLDEPADLVGLSLGCEYAARAGLQAAAKVRRLALIAPTGLTRGRGPSAFGRAGIALAAATGTFELLFYRLARRSSLRDFYERQVFIDPDAIPDDLVNYAYVTAHVLGAHHAPRRFIDGTLFLEDVADSIYSRLYRPTLLLTPEDPAPTVQRFDRLPDVLDANGRDLTHRALPGGLLPHWEDPEPFFHALMEWIDAR
jgi:pimeloyl-ACP methyl ester carboxylesterase